MTDVAEEAHDELVAALRQAESVLSLLHYRGITDSAVNRDDVRTTLDKVRKALRPVGPVRRRSDYRTFLQPGDPDVIEARTPNGIPMGRIPTVDAYRMADEGGYHIHKDGDEWRLCRCETDDVEGVPA